jgi:hypothetical protein
LGLEGKPLHQSPLEISVASPPNKLQDYGTCSKKYRALFKFELSDLEQQEPLQQAPI